MVLGEVPADWRHRRLAVRAVPSPSDAIPVVRFLDVEAAETRALLRNELGELLAYYGSAISMSPQCAAEIAASLAGSAAGPTSSAMQTIASSLPASATCRDSPPSGSAGRCLRTWRSTNRRGDS